MCDPLTMTVAATAVAATGKAVSGLMAAQGQRYQAKVAAANQKAENARAADALARGEVDQVNLSRRYASLRGAQRASMAANGIDLGFGSAADIQGDTATYQAEDTATTARNTMSEVRGIEISAANFGAGAKAARMAATGTLISTGFDVANTVLGGLGDYGKIKAKRAPAAAGFGG